MGELVGISQNRLLALWARSEGKGKFCGLELRGFVQRGPLDQRQSNQVGPAVCLSRWAAGLPWVDTTIVIAVGEHIFIWVPHCRGAKFSLQSQGP